MSDIRPSATIMEDSATQAGVPLHKVLEGNSLTSKNAHGAFVAKDGSGNAAYLKVNSAGELTVAADSALVANLADTSTTAGSATFVAVATITLQNSFTYRRLAYALGCYRDAEFKVQWNDNGTPVDLLFGPLVGQGTLSENASIPEFEFVSGATATQELKLMAKNPNALSDFRGFLSIQEVQP